MENDGAIVALVTVIIGGILLGIRMIVAAVEREQDKNRHNREDSDAR